MTMLLHHVRTEPGAALHAHREPDSGGSRARGPVVPGEKSGRPAAIRAGSVASAFGREPDGAVDQRTRGAMVAGACAERGGSRPAER